MKVLVIDIGGTSIKYACMKEDMTILTRGKMDTPKENRDQLIETIGTIYDEMPDVEGIAISMPGIIDSDCATMMISICATVFIKDVR